jgi:hypothetical protein
VPADDSEREATGIASRYAVANARVLGARNQAHNCRFYRLLNNNGSWTVNPFAMSTLREGHGRYEFLSKWREGHGVFLTPISVGGL